MDTDIDRYKELGLFAALFEDVQQMRISSANKVLRGGAAIGPFEVHLEAIQRVENELKKTLIAVYRLNVPKPIQDWVRDPASKGLGEPSIARLLGTIGDPVIATPYHWEGEGSTKSSAGSVHASSEDHPGTDATGRTLVAGEPYTRTLSQLRSYCGVGDPNRKRRTGMSQEDALALGNPEAKKILWNLAQSVVKTGKGGLYRLIYDDARSEYVDKMHSVPCNQCGTKGKPAAEGTPWKLGHQHGASLRKVMKAIVADLWAAARKE